MLLYYDGLIWGVVLVVHNKMIKIINCIFHLASVMQWKNTDVICEEFLHPEDLTFFFLSIFAVTMCVWVRFQWLSSLKQNDS